MLGLYIQAKKGIDGYQIRDEGVTSKRTYGGIRLVIGHLSRIGKTKEVTQLMDGLMGGLVLDQLCSIDDI